MKKTSTWPFTVTTIQPALTQLTFDNSSSLRGRAYAHIREGCNSAPKASDALWAGTCVLESRPTLAGLDRSAAPCHMASQGGSA